MLDSFLDPALDFGSANVGSRRGAGSGLRSVVLCIAGFDPCGGAGLLADARACAAFGAHALCAQTALVPQNTLGVRALATTPPDLLRLQLEVLSEDIAFDAIKIGLLPNVASIEIVGDFLAHWKRRASLPVVVDPVLAPTRGASWSDAESVAALCERVLPLATIVTPNAPEAQILTGRALVEVGEMEAVARAVLERCGAQSVLLKGGHLPDAAMQRAGDGADNQSLVIDLYLNTRGSHQLRAPRVGGAEVRGTGCLLASAIAAQLASGCAPLVAARNAKAWMTNLWRDAQPLGHGRRIAAF